MREGGGGGVSKRGPSDSEARGSEATDGAACGEAQATARPKQNIEDATMGVVSARSVAIMNCKKKFNGQGKGGGELTESVRVIPWSSMMICDAV